MCSDHLTAAAPATDLNELFDRLVKKIYDQKVKAGDLDADTWRATTGEYWQAIKDGWGSNPKYFSKAQQAILELRSNVNTYAAFKNHANIIELTGSLTGKDGKPLSFAEFKKQAATISEKYNVNWLQAEYNYATGAAKSAAQWEGFIEKGGKLEYKTIGDGRVREAHRVLDGTILEVDHPFWKTYYPPNGWNCRCFVRHRPEDTASVPPTSVLDIADMFKNNVGITGQIFDDSHPFIKEIGIEQSEKIRAMAEKETIRWERTFIKDVARENLIGKSVDVKIGEAQQKVTFNSAGIKEAINQPHEDLLEKNRAILNIEQLIKDALYINTQADALGDLDVKRWHYLGTVIGGKQSFIVLKEYATGETVFYSIVDRMK